MTTDDGDALDRLRLCAIVNPLAPAPPDAWINEPCGATEPAQIEPAPQGNRV